MLVNFSEILAAARRDKYAAGSFNVYNYETIRGVTEVACELGLPAIVAFGENYLPNMDLDEVAALVKTRASKANVPLVLHLDHCKSFDNIMRAIRAGFTSVMYDGSSLSLAENTRRTADIVKIAHAVGVSVEAELGALASGDFTNEDGGEEIYTNPLQAEEFVTKTGVDALAVSVGTVHGMYKGEPRVDIGVLKKIAALVEIPLVLHGGSGTPESIIHECIRNGIAKINVNTEISMFTMDKVEALLASGKKPHFSQVCLKEVDAVKEVVKKYTAIFRSA